MESSLPEMGFENTPDPRLIAFYLNIREQVNADAALGSEHRLVGENAKQYAQSLEDEMQRRGLALVPIVWP
jgi:hypothetical protein